MLVGLFFGSFNPIHLGHTRLAEYILAHTDLDEIWLIVSPNNPLKAAHTLLPEDIRFRLAQMATAELDGIRASDFEFALPKPNYTINTLRALDKAYPDHQFSLIIGSDNMAIFSRWRQADEIERDYRIIVYPREGDDIAALQAQHPTMQVVTGAPFFPISATTIRENLANGLCLDEWLHPNVAQFLQKNNKLFGQFKKKC